MVRKLESHNKAEIYCKMGQKNLLPILSIRSFTLEKTIRKILDFYTGEVINSDLYCDDVVL